MIEEYLKHDIESIFQCKENEDFAICQSLRTIYAETRAQLGTVVHECLANKIEYARKSKCIANELPQIHAEVKCLMTNLDDILLQEKVINKKICNIVKQQEDVQIEIERERKQKEKLSLEMVDSQQELEEKKTKMREKWDAIKKACAVFKETLQLHIRLDTIEEEEFIRISFFVNLNIAMDEYTHYVDLVHSNNFWKVKKIEPNLELEHEEELIKVVDFKKQLNTVHVTMLLYKQLLLLNLGLETVNHSVDKLLRSYVQVSALSLYGTYHM
ncbi:uncharacterized protein LOC107266195 isoform X3 [Cephus cinctus]|uniref:Uncharacterized protein LOC107266195 isoform X3 n=1 Tax=Cephus cinctus TaxID=211228 RepID=A0AAJ7BRP0_CEPCN|nr:uncharacterized protein LOC107266195 isoform X3 [Cephus cinctus]